MVNVEVLRGVIDGYGSGFGFGFGYGDAYGFGYGSGDGSGYGSGYGDGYGFGSGYGSGYGDGSGYGYGEGYGYGSGYGYGEGDGEGDGSGYGEGEGDYWRAVLFTGAFMKKWSDSQRKRLDELIASNVHLAFWRSTVNGQPANKGKTILKADVGVRHKTAGPLLLCEAGTLHATMIPTKWKGERLWIVALHGEVIGDDEKFGCLEREIVGECILNQL